MATTIKQLIDKNKQAFDNNYFIESLHLSYVLLNKASRQIIKDELKQTPLENKIKFTSLIGHIKKEYVTNPNLKAKLSKKVVKDIELFIDLYKSINKELKYQYPEKKITDTAQLGINCLIILNTSLLKIKNNKVV
ncbi:MAG: hypothetical protein K0S53_729 [Bacteroidetes bacterium]|jgi:hypothetical protein|nr:hypothetical protein [Bacteroidota bacterium]MDF2451813.1 hypothetical protein [Bacteroidota bacterium]